MRIIDRHAMGEILDPNTFSTINRGSNSRDVEFLQTKLIEYGYDIGKSGIDGDFGPSTENAVKFFQAINSLPVDGIVDTKVWSVLLSEQAKAYDSTKAALVAPTLSLSLVPTSSTLSTAAKSNIVTIPYFQPVEVKSGFQQIFQSRWTMPVFIGLLGFAAYIYFKSIHKELKRSNGIAKNPESDYLGETYGRPKLEIGRIRINRLKEELEKVEDESMKKKIQKQINRLQEILYPPFSQRILVRGNPCDYKEDEE